MTPSESNLNIKRLVKVSSLYHVGLLLLWYNGSFPNLTFLDMQIW